MPESRAVFGSNEQAELPERHARFLWNRVARPRSLSGGAADRLAHLFPRCGHSRCSSGRMRLWRSSRVPVFEGRWACSAACLRAMVEAAVGREGPGENQEHGEAVPRIPLGLMLLEQGQISEQQLREAMESSRNAGEEMELKDWLLSSGLLSEAALTRAISAQWNCPVFVLSGSRAEQTASVLPRFLAEAIGVLPVRVSGDRMVCLAFSERIDRSLSYAVEHISGLRVAAGIARESEFRREQTRFLSGPSPKTRFLEAEDGQALARSIAAWIEEEQPVDARLARVHEMWWVRIWRREPHPSALPARGAVEDLLATVGTAGQNAGGPKLEESAIPPIKETEGNGLSCRE